MTGRPDDTRLHDWLEDTVGPDPDPVEGTRQVMSQVEETSQVGRWLPFPVLHRRIRTRASATDGTTEYRAGPISPTNGHTHTVIGRTHTMLSPVKAISVSAIAATAIAFALGGVLLIVGPFSQQGGSAPGAETEAIAPTWVTGSITYAPGCRRPAPTQDGAVTHKWNIVCEPQAWTSSDPRFTGKTSLRANEDHHQTEEGAVVVGTNAYYVSTDGGSWVCSFTWVLAEFAEEGGDTLVCVGEGGYEGLSAVLYQQPGPVRQQFAGLIFSGDVPPVPEPPAAE